MIKNSRQYRITKAQVRKFENALAAFQQIPAAGESVHPMLRKAQEDAMRSQLEDLRAELAEYDALRSGRRRVLELDSFEELPHALIQARIATGITQRELAGRLGVKEQQIQRYEATDYASASFSRIAAIMKALGVEVKERVVLPAIDR